MKKILIMSACLMLAITSVLGLASCVVEMPDGERFDDSSELWDVVFLDEFKGDKLDTTKWRINTMEAQNNVRRGGYVSDDPLNIFVKDDALTIRTNYRNGNRGEGWYSSWVETSKSGGVATADDYQGFNSVGGYFEIKCKVPKTKSIWSAFWLMPDEGVAFSDDDVQWTAKDGAEIDIMESFAYTQGKSYTQHVVHADGYGVKLKSEKSVNFEIDDMYDTFHTYAVEWAADKYSFYIDGIKTWESKHKFMGKNLGVSEVLQYMILSVEVAGKSEQIWAGDPSKNDKTLSYDYVIDHVKVMQRK